MSLQEKLYQDLKQALLAKSEPKLSTLRLIKSDIQYELTKTGASTISDDQIIQILRKNSAKRKESSQEYRKVGRNDLAEKEEAEDQIIVSYLPASLPEEEIRKTISDVIAELNPKPNEIGKVIGKVMQELKGKNVEGGVVSNLVKSMMSGAS